MPNPTPFSHLYRLSLVLVVFMVLFVFVKTMFTPASWNDEVWYRGDALVEMESQAIVHGGNQSCVECHSDESQDVEINAHKKLNCEGCHGALTIHVRDGRKIADAVGKSDWQCLNCHQQKISLPTDHPQFPGEIRKHENIKKDTLCVKCHDPHDPALSGEEEEETDFEF